jgi:hypothetical protein
MQEIRKSGSVGALGEQSPGATRQGLEHRSVCLTLKTPASARPGWARRARDRRLG